MNSEFVDICVNFQKILFNTRAAKWMSYEWSFDDIDDEFFNKTNDFDLFLREYFPALKTRQLTRAEWRKLRRYVNPQHKRLLSPKYLHEKRSELRRFRQGIMTTNKPSISIGSRSSNAAEYIAMVISDESTVSDLASNAEQCSHLTAEDIQSIGEILHEPQIDDASQESNFGNDSDNHLFKLLIETSNFLSRKTVLLTRIKQIMKSIQDDTVGNRFGSKSVKNGIDGELIIELYNLNKDILANFEKLWDFKQVKATLQFSSAIRIKADFFHRKNQLAILLKFKQLQVDSIQEYQVLSAVIESLLKIAYSLMDCELHSRESFTENLTEEINKLKILSPADSLVFEEKWYPQLLSMFIVGTKKDMDTNIMQYIT